MWTLAILVVVLVLGVALVKRRSLANLFMAGRAQVNKVSEKALDADPMAVLNQIIVDATEGISKSRKGINKAAGDVRSCQREVNECVAEKTSLESRIQVAVDSGDPNNTARGYALELADVEKRLEEAKFDLEDAQKRFTEDSRNLALCKKKIDEAKVEARRLGRQLESSERTRELEEFANTFDPESFDSQLQAVRDVINRKVDDNLGAGDAEKAINPQKYARLKDEQLVKDQKADDILARFKKPAN